MRTARIDERVRHWAGAVPDRTAVVAGAHTLTYARLDALADEVAESLADTGVAVGDTVAYVGRNEALHPVLAVACARLGAVLVPVGWRGTVDDVEHVLRDSRCVAVVVVPEFAPLVRPGPWRRIALVGTDPAELSAAVRNAGPPAEPVQQTPTHDSDLLALTYTSGTTGDPKGVMIGHAQVASYAFRDAPWIPREDDVVLIVSPVFHTAGWVWVALGQLHGATVVLVPDADPEHTGAAIREHRPTVTLMVPALIQILLADERSRSALDSIRMLTYGAATMPRALIDDLLAVAPHTLLAQGYGLSETTGTITALGPEEHGPGARHLLSVGRALPGIEIAIVDPGTDEEVPEGEVGEIRTRSGQDTLGYWQRPEATERLVRDGWLCTGDLGRMIDGYVYLVDRVDDMIRSGGEKVPPSEVEAVIARIPGVRDVVVVGTPHERWGQAVTAAIVLEEGASVTADQVVAACEEGLARFKIPRYVEWLTELPRNPNGKVLRRKVRADLSERG